MGVVLLACVLAVTGCAANPSGYMERLRDETPALVDEFSETQLVELGEAVCTVLDDGGTGHDAAGTLEQNGFTLAEAGTIVLAASDNLCPQHADDVN